MHAYAYAHTHTHTYTQVRRKLSEARPKLAEMEANGYSEKFGKATNPVCWRRGQGGYVWGGCTHSPVG